MTTAIESVTIDTIEDRRLVLNNSQFAALMDIGSSWTRLRVGFRMAVTDTLGHITGTPRFFAGIQSTPDAGLVNGPLNAGTNHFLGLRTDATQWNRVSGASSYYTHSANNFATKKVGLAVTTGTIASVNVHSSLTPSANRNAWFVEFEKDSSVQTTVKQCIPNDTSSDTGDVSEAILRTAMNLDSITAVATYVNLAAGVSNYGVGSYAMATDEAVDGAWDSIVFGWSNNSDMHISEMLYVVLEE